MFGLYETEKCRFTVKKMMAIEDAARQKLILISRHDTKADAVAARKLQEERRDSAYVIVGYEDSHRLFREYVFNRVKRNIYYYKVLERFTDFASASTRYKEICAAKKAKEFEKNAEFHKRVAEVRPALDVVIATQGLDPTKAPKRLKDGDFKYLEWKMKRDANISNNAV